MKKKMWCRLIEAVILYVFLIGALYTFVRPGVLMPTLWLVTIIAWIYLGRKKQLDKRLPSKQALKIIVKRWLIASILIMMLAYLVIPERFLILPKEQPLLWVMIMVFYPLLSVIPQTIVYRQLWFKRYAQVFTTKTAQVIAGGMLFGFMHIVFQNPIAPALATIGGLLFAYTHQKHGMYAGCIEHALYGMIIFTSGIGWFFYGGAM